MIRSLSFVLTSGPSHLHRLGCLCLPETDGSSQNSQYYHQTCEAPLLESDREEDRELVVSAHSWCLVMLILQMG